MKPSPLELSSFIKIINWFTINCTRICLHEPTAATLAPFGDYAAPFGDYATPFGDYATSFVYTTVGAYARWSRARSLVALVAPRGHAASARRRTSAATWYKTTSSETHLLLLTREQCRHLLAHSVSKTTAHLDQFDFVRLRFNVTLNSHVKPL